MGCSLIHQKLQVTLSSINLVACRCTDFVEHDQTVCENYIPYMRRGLIRLLFSIDNNGNKK